MKLQLERIELREIEMPLKTRFETSFGTTTKRRILLIKVCDAGGASGWSECVAMENPFYNPETIETAWTIITKFIVPMLKAKNVLSAEEVSAALKSIIGNRMAIAAVEMAVWDMEAKRANVPLWQHLGGTKTEINCGVSIGIQKTTDELIEAVARELESGYQRIKIKIKPGHDLE